MARKTECGTIVGTNTEPKSPGGASLNSDRNSQNVHIKSIPRSGTLNLPQTSCIILLCWYLCIALLWIALVMTITATMQHSILLLCSQDQTASKLSLPALNKFSCFKQTYLIKEQISHYTKFMQI